ncbi:vacuolar protein sorting-associated protein vps17 [Hysterangium stoloniferum]|nr:vacuolar protein sorting-associated protein vps17 [Hysterangium stoloniferum]
MYDPLNSGFSDASASDAMSPPWPTTPYTAQPTHPTLVKSQPTSPNAQSSSSAGPLGRVPQIYGQPEPGLISPSSNKGANGANFERPEPYLRVRITGMDRNRRDILVRFDAQTNLPNFTGQTYRNVSRSYFEFQQFSEQIVYCNPQTIIPALPLAQTSAPSDDEDDRLVRVMLQRWFTRICEDQILLQDEELRLFIESDFGYQPTPRARRRTSGFSLIKRDIPDEDEALQRARFELTKLETQYFDAAKSVDRLARARKALAVSQAEMGNKLVTVATTEAHPPLASAIKKFGRTWHSLADLDQAQAISECVILGDSMGYQGLNARSAKETLMQRTAVLEDHQAAVKTTITKRRQIERLKSSTNIRPDRVDEALEDLDEADKYEKMIARRVDGISQNLHRALHRHSRLSQEDVTIALIEHSRTTIMYEKQLLRELEALRPDFNNADKKAPLPAPVKVPPPTRPVTPPRVGGAVPSAPVPPIQQQQQRRQYQPQQPPPVQRPVIVASQTSPVTPSGPIRAYSSQSPLGPPLSSPGAGPSTPHASSTFMDGSKSMFITPTDPLLSPGPPSETQTVGRFAGAENTRNGMHRPLAASMIVQPQPSTMRRLDAREAAAKLANFL